MGRGAIPHKFLHIQQKLLVTYGGWMANHPYFNRWVGTFHFNGGVEDLQSAMLSALQLPCNQAAGTGTRFGIGSGGEDVVCGGGRLSFRDDGSMC